MSLSEKEVKRQIRDWLNKTLAKQLHYVSVAGIGTVYGQPDVIGLIDGRYFALEIKPSKWKPPSDPVKLAKPGKMPSVGSIKTWNRYQTQVREINRIKAAGGLAGFCRSIEEAAEILGITRVQLFQESWIWPGIKEK